MASKTAQLQRVERQLELKAEEFRQLQEDQSARISASQKDDDRIEELEEALRESVRITADRELALHSETQQRMQISEKVDPAIHFVNFQTPFK